MKENVASQFAATAGASQKSEQNHNQSYVKLQAEITYLKLQINIRWTQPLSHSYELIP